MAITEKQLADAKSLMHQALFILRDRVEVGQVPIPAFGICPNIDHILTKDFGRLDLAASNAAYRVLRELFEQWPRIAMMDLMTPGVGQIPNLSYPVDGYAGYTTDRLTGRMWRNKRRLELLDWLINQPC